MKRLTTLDWILCIAFAAFSSWVTHNIVTNHFGEQIGDSIGFAAFILYFKLEVIDSKIK